MGNGIRMPEKWVGAHKQEIVQSTPPQCVKLVV